EAQQVAPVRIVAEAGIGPMTGAAPRRVRDEEGREPPVELVGDLADRREAARADRALDAQRVAVEVVIALERLDHEVVDREPDRPAPVGVAAEEPGVRFRPACNGRHTPGYAAGCGAVPAVACGR